MKTKQLIITILMITFVTMITTKVYNFNETNTKRVKKLLTK